MSEPVATPTTPQEAYDAGHRIGTEGGARLYDLTGQMNDLGIPAPLRGRWLAGIEDAYEALGMNVDDDDSDGGGWERRALAGAHALP